jgi:PleD family two-component response regulator
MDATPQARHGTVGQRTDDGLRGKRQRDSEHDSCIKDGVLAWDSHLRMDNVRQQPPLPSGRCPDMTDTRLETAPPLVLLANDQEWSARSLESILGPQGFATVRAYTGRQALELARRTQPDVLIVDDGLPDISGIDVCERLREDLEFPSSTPLIVTTAGPASRAQRLSAHRAGAWEYLSLPVDADALILKLSVFVKAKREIDRSRDGGLLDATTGLYNVRGLARRAREIGAEAARRHAPLACVAIATVPCAPIHNGDGELRRPIAERLSDICRRTARSSDAVGRLGGGQFGFVAPSTDNQGAIRMVERLRESIEASTIAEGGQAYRFNVRGGYCAVSDFAQSSVDAVEMLLRAEAALRHERLNENASGISAFEDVPGRFLQ